jgi:hypothetical protein
VPTHAQAPGSTATTGGQSTTNTVLWPEEAETWGTAWLCACDGTSGQFSQIVRVRAPSAISPASLPIDRQCSCHLNELIVYLSAVCDIQELALQRNGDGLLSLGLMAVVAELRRSGSFLPALIFLFAVLASSRCSA